MTSNIDFFKKTSVFPIPLQQLVERNMSVYESDFESCSEVSENDIIEPIVITERDHTIGSALSEANIKSYQGDFKEKRNIAWLIENNKSERTKGSLNSINHGIREDYLKSDPKKPQVTKSKVSLPRSSQHSLVVSLNEELGSKTSFIQTTINDDDGSERREETRDDLYHRKVYPVAFLGPARLDYLHQLEYEFRPPTSMTESSETILPQSPAKEDFEIFENVTAQDYLRLCGLHSKRVQSACYSSNGVKERLKSQLAEHFKDCRSLKEKILELADYTSSLEKRNSDWLERYEEAWNNRNKGALQVLVAERELTKLYQKKHSRINSSEQRQTKPLPKLEGRNGMLNEEDISMNKPSKPSSRRSSRLTITAFDKLTNFIREPQASKKKRPTSPLKREYSERAAQNCSVVFEELFDLNKFNEREGDLTKAKLNVEASSFGKNVEAPVMKRQKRINIETKIEQNAIIVKTALKPQRSRKSNTSTQEKTGKRGQNPVHGRILKQRHWKQFGQQQTDNYQHDNGQESCQQLYPSDRTTYELQKWQQSKIPHPPNEPRVRRSNRPIRFKSQAGHFTRQQNSLPKILDRSLRQ